MINKIKIKIFNILRYYVRKDIVGNLGKVIEEKDKIICYVEKNKLKKDEVYFIASCYGINDSNRKLVNFYNLNKPICYVFDGLEFDKRVFIFGYDDVEIIIKNCKFNQGLSTSIKGRALLDDSCLSLSRTVDVNARKLMIKNMNISNKLKFVNSYLQIIFSAEEDIDIVNSNIGRENENTIISVVSNKQINIVNSKLKADSIKCKSEDIKMDQDSIIIADELNIGNSNVENLKLMLIQDNKKETTVIVKNASLAMKRLELIERLKSIKAKCMQVNEEKLLKYKEVLDNRAISRTLRKK